ncbi:paired small multidrug resistance pump [Aneurinibacillus soli]|uniref:Multidrug resistance protein YkkD n=1 Tax=Aneurinibacillus soli TaxID=1500254 RepID=A0A0U4WJ24_9BACL|nr:SMR family transporter [Aneurinibacillus soli]PYE62242.1 paired small multidrug resistance pump [Aneurinibacillus soli]BAU28569.1 Multidrug resistance protein YkkD [Aneurinibacillus soli]
MGWLFVFLAAVSEMVGVVGLKLYSQNKTIRNGSIYIGGLGAAFAFLYASFNYLQVSIAYSVWIGMGTAGAVLLNMVFFGESKNAARIVSLIAIVIGVTGLKSLS